MKGVGKTERKDLSVEEHVDGVIRCDPAILGRTITLVESNAPEDRDRAEAVLERLLPRAGGAVRVAVTGVPGVGKSTFIDALGALLHERGRKVAVLAVDPSSSITRGSILGDKTRMERLARLPGCFIRPSPSCGTLGGVARKSREIMLVCEAAGFDVVLVETVGVGQSEVAVRSMVDFFLLLLVAGAGDELQGIKRGIMELADAVAVNKADGDNVARAEAARVEYESALCYLLPATEGWRTRAFSCSAVTGAGVASLWSVVEDLVATTRASGAFEERRRRQTLDWARALVIERLERDFFAHPEVERALPEVERALAVGTLPVTVAVSRLFEAFGRRNPQS